MNGAMDDQGDPRTPSWEELRDRAGLVAILSDEVDRQLQSVGARASSMSTRASLLVGAAGIMTGLQVAPDGDRPWQYIASLVAAGLAALVGVIALIPRGAPEVPILAAERTFWNYTASESRWTLAHWKLDTLRDQERALKWRALVVVAGFASLTIAIIFAASALLVPPA